ncbi:HNH endonuclease [Psychrobacter sp. DAB_AL43B]|uniref:HNH endonuclease n=1 Tax=Psychrobacter sp. DAB_AL43B TaxID=1028416 RepID=UPI0009A90006|nr:HNH endonuclease [Psychrobacter sp. DAB_AL43B]SLJ83687.1 hypothetical protein DABAL43B_0473 [Psychrobacter sp. DAB_AL43B]
MTAATPTIDPYLFEKQYEAFTKFVEEKSGVPFVSFASHPYTDEQEGYKYQIYRAARDKLSFQAWKITDIGNGEIISATIEAIEFQNNNLVPWQNRYGDKNRPHQPLYEAANDSAKVKEIETALFNLYHTSNDENSFNEIIKIFGRNYSILAYLYFIKDSSKYLPIAPTYFDKAFALLGADFKTNKRCSWENYFVYLKLINTIKTMLIEELENEVSLLDAHSFTWMLSAQMEKENALTDVSGYLNLSRTERDSIIKSRIGQGQFRQSLINYWSACAVTGCEEQKLLRASHIKPWSKSEDIERLSLYNGLLLSPNLDLCFDAGFISFDNLGHILISHKMNITDLEALSINKDMKLSIISPEHEKYLQYHREHIYKEY